MKIKKLHYSDLKNVPIIENNSPFVLANKFDKSIDLKKNLKPGITEKDKETIFFIREEVARKIFIINQKIKQILGEEYSLQIGFGYRSLETQTRFFENKIKQILAKAPQISRNSLYEEAHEKVAVPEVSGHPTGGAVDVTIINNGIPLDMGTPLSDTSTPEYKEKVKLTTTEITPVQQENREFLNKLMTKEGFAPFWGEWWHFSFGDKEWAAYYNKPNAIYSQKNSSEIIY